MNEYNVTYEGYKDGSFVFTTEKGNTIKLFSSEVCPILSDPQIVKVMNQQINHKFIIGVYPASDGYFVRERFVDKKIVYDLYDGVFKKFSGITIDDKKDIPKQINGKKVSLYGKKILLKKL